jgi:N-acetylneuraminate lyase/4-hydroxy-tetrahydrodipicolinate synthase
MFKPEGVYVAMMTPFTEDGSINQPEMGRIVDFLVERGVDGLFPVSTVGEYIHLNREEKVLLMEIVHSHARGRVAVTPGVASSHPSESIFLAERAKEIGCDAVVIAPPHVIPLSQEMIEKYFETIIDAVDIPVILYNIPMFTQTLSYDLVKRLSRRNNVVGMKDSSGSMVDFLHFMDKIRLVGEDMHVLTGREETFFASLMMGGKGCMTVTSGILPEIMVDIYEAWKSGDYEAARDYQFSILLAIRAWFSLPFPMGFKAAMETRGFDMGPPKQPFSDAEQFKFKIMRARIEKIMAPIIETLDARAASQLP